MSFKVGVLGLAAVFTGCATAEGTGGDGAGITARVDARPGADGDDADASSDEPDGPPIERPDARRPPDASPPDAAPCTKTWLTLLRNGTFDTGPGGGWNESSASGLALVTNDFEGSGLTGHTGAYAAWLGGTLNGNDTLRQTVMVPEGATRLRLSGYRVIATEETSAAQNDKMDFELRATGAATVLETLGTFGDNNGVLAWTAFQFEATSAHEGTTVDLVIHATTNATLNTNFFVDSLVLEAFACPP